MSDSRKPEYVRVYDKQWQELGRVLGRNFHQAHRWDEQTKTNVTDLSVIMDIIMQSDWLENERRDAYTVGMREAEKMIDSMRETLDDNGEQK